MKKILLALAIPILLIACKKEKPLTELEKLPPATQTGANTFGCLVNGKAWVAQRNDCSIICDPSFKMYYDGSGGGSISLLALMINSTNNIDQEIIISFDSSNYKQIFVFDNTPHVKFAYTDYNSNSTCGDLHSIDSGINAIGNIKFQKYDLTSGIISGTFEFTLTKPGCPMISITDGRFDKKL